MNRFDLPPEVMALGEKVERPKPTGEAPEDCWRKHPTNPGLQVNGLGQLRTAFALPDAAVADLGMQDRDVVTDWDDEKTYTASNYHIAQFERLTGIRVPNPDYTAGHFDEPDFARSYSTAEIAAAQAEVALLRSAPDPQMKLQYEAKVSDMLGAQVWGNRPTFRVGREDGNGVYGTYSVPAAELRNDEVRQLQGELQPSAAHADALQIEIDRLDTRITARHPTMPDTWHVVTLREATDDQVVAAYDATELDSDYERRMGEELERRGL